MLWNIPTSMTAPADLVTAQDLNSLGQSVSEQVGQGAKVSVNAVTLNTLIQYPQATNLHQIIDVEVTTPDGHTTSYLFQGSTLLSQGGDLAYSLLNARLYMAGTEQPVSFVSQLRQNGAGYVQNLVNDVPQAQVGKLFDAIGAVADYTANNDVMIMPMQNCITMYTNVYNQIRDQTELLPPNSSAPLGSPLLQSIFGANQPLIAGDLSENQIIAAGLITTATAQMAITGINAAAAEAVMTFLGAGAVVAAPYVLFGAIILAGAGLAYEYNTNKPIDVTGTPIRKTPLSIPNFMNLPQTVWMAANPYLQLARMDPLTIDLTGKGVQFEELSPASPYFDFKNDGHPEQTSWIAPGTGILVDVGPGGIVRNGGDLIGSFAQLAEVDAQHTGVLDASDPGFANLAIWNDSNSDGVCEPGEVISLSAAGIQAIRLNVSRAPTQMGDVVIEETATALMQDGSTREVAQVDLPTDTMNTISASPINISQADLSLPFLNGYGELDNLWVACGNDPVLTQLTTELTQTDPEQVSGFDDRLKAVLMQWAGVGSSGASPASTFDAEKLAFMQKLFGDQSAFGGGGAYPTLADQATYLQEAWNTVFSALKARVLVQLPESPLVQAFVFDPIRDVIVPSGSLESAIATASSSLATPAVSGMGAAINALEVINASVRDIIANNLGDTSAALSDLETAFSGIISEPVLAAVATGQLSVFESYDAGTTLYGSSTANLFVLDQPGVTIEGRYGTNYVVLENGAFNVVLADQGPSQSATTLNLDDGVSLSQLEFQGDRTGDLSIVSGGQTLFEIQDALVSPSSGFVGLQLPDGTQLSLQEVIARELSATTNTSGTIYGTSGADVLDGQGVDTLLGGNGGGDTFVYNQGYGNLEISEQDATNLSSDVLSLGTGIAASDVCVTSDAAGDLILNVDGGANGSIKVDQMLASATKGLGAVQFSDGTTWTRQQLLTMADTGSATNTTITSMLPGQVVDPAGFVHSVDLAGGNSVVKFGLGYGQVEINQVDPNGADQNTLVFESGIAPSDVTVSTDGQGNIILSVGSNGDVVKLDGMLFGPNNGVQSIHFDDGTTWSAQSVVAQVSQTTPTGYYNTATFDKGMGNVVMSSQGISAIEFGPDIASGDAIVQGDQAGNLVIHLKDDPNDTLTLMGDIHQVATNAGLAESIVHQLSYADGSSISLQGGLTFTYVGNSDVRQLTGSNMATNVFDLGVGGDHIVAGNNTSGGSGLNQIYFDRGDGAATADMNGGKGIVFLGTGITSADIGLQSDTAGNLVIKILDTGDTLTVANGLTQSPWGPTSPITALQFSDGTSMPLALTNFYPQPLTYSWVGVGNGTAMVGSPWGPNSFIVGPNDAHIVAGNGSESGNTPGFDRNIFYYDQGDGNAVVDMNGGSGEVDLAADVLPQSVIFQADATGDLTISFLGDTSDSLELKGDLFQTPWGVASRVDTVAFGDGTSLKLGIGGSFNSPITFTSAGTATNTNLVGSGWGANVFDLGPGGDTVTAGNGAQGGANSNTFLFDRGDGAATVNMNGGTGTVQVGADIMPQDVLLQADAQGDLTISVAGDPADSITLLADLSWSPWGPRSTVNEIKFADGTEQGLGITAAESNPMVFTYVGTATNTTLVGSNLGSNVFDFGPGGDAVTAGAGDNTFAFGLGDRHAVVNMNGGTGILKLDTSVSSSDLIEQADNNGDLTVSFRSDPTSSITFNGDLRTTPWGVNSQLTEVMFADGTSQQVTPGQSPPNLTYIGTTTNTTLMGSNYGTNTFVFGPALTDGSGDQVTAGNGSAGGSTVNTFDFGLGDGHATVNLNGGGGQLVLGAGLTASQVIFQGTDAGDLTVSFRGDAADSITFKGDFVKPWWGGTTSQMNHINFNDGSSMTVGELSYFVGGPIPFTWLGTAQDATYTGTNWGTSTFELASANDTVISEQADTVKGGSGNDTIHAGGSSILVNASSGATLLDGSAQATVNMAQGGSLTYAGTSSATVNVTTSAQVAISGSASTTIQTSAGTASSITLGTGPSTVNSQGQDTVMGGMGSGQDVVSVGAGGLTFVGGSNSANIHGGTGALNIAQGSGSMMVNGSSGNDTLVGGSGDLTFTEGNGAVTNQFGSGNATVAGGTGVDLYTLLFGSSSGSGTISGFKVGTDLIHLIGYSSSEAQNAVANETVSGGNTMLAFTGGEHLTLNGVTGLTASSFS